MSIKTNRDMRTFLFHLDNQEMTVRELRAAFYSMKEQDGGVSPESVNVIQYLPEATNETATDDYDWQDDTDDRGWLTYGERMASQSRAEM